LTGRQPKAEVTFLATVERYRVPLYRYALRVAEDPVLAEEAVQEALTRGWKAQVEGRPPKQWGAWLYRVTHNVAVDELRRRERTARPFPAEPGEAEREDPEPGLAVTSPDEEAERRARGETVRQALSLLPDRYRYVLFLREEEGLSYEEIAEVLGVRPGNVKVLLHRARASFASLYCALVLVRAARAALAGPERGAEGVCPELAGLLAEAPASPAAVLADARLRRRVEQHLQQCPSCLVQREEYRRTGELFGLLPPVVLPPSLLGWRPGEAFQAPGAPAPDAGSAAGDELFAEQPTAAGQAGGTRGVSGSSAGGPAVDIKAGGLASVLKAKVVVLAGLALLGAAVAGAGYAVMVRPKGNTSPRETGAPVGAPAPVPSSAEAGGQAGSPSPAEAGGPGEQGSDVAGAEDAGGFWLPWGLRAGDRLRYRLVQHADAGAREGWFSLSLKEAGQGLVEARWEGEWDGRSFTLAQTGPPGTVASPFSLLALSMGNPAAGPFLAAVSGTLWAPWFVHFQGQVLAPGTGWEFPDESGAVRSVKVEQDCREAGWAGWLVVMRTGEKKLAESCLSPRVPLPLSVRLWDEDDGRLRYEAVAVEYRPGS